MKIVVDSNRVFAAFIKDSVSHRILFHDMFEFFVCINRPYAEIPLMTLLGEIVIIMGYPAAGKSTQARALLDAGYVRFNRDEIKLTIGINGEWNIT